MLREIKNAIYCIASYTGNRHFVECDSEDELAAYVAEGECKKYAQNIFFTDYDRNFNFLIYFNVCNYTV